MGQPNLANMHALAKYNRVDIQTGIDDASPYRLIQMLMEGVLARITSAKLALKQSDIDRKCESISSAISIIGGLRDSLDHEVGGEIASNLDNLYSYMSERLVQANLKNDIDILSEVHVLFQEIKTTWDKIGHVNEDRELRVNSHMQQRKTG